MDNKKPSGRKGRDVTQEEAALWREHAASDKKIKTKKLPPVVKATVKKTLEAPRPMPREDNPMERGDYAGIDHNTAERFRKEDMKVQATLDLHGNTREEAYQRLVAFILKMQAQGKRKLLVVTGKGVGEEGGVLRKALPFWLGDSVIRGHILAYDYAQVRDGGTGAFYVLLKRSRE